MDRLLRVSVSDVTLHGFHGIFAQEEAVGNDFIFTLNVWTAPRAAVSDILADTVSYADLFEIIRTESAVRALLLEHLAERILSAVFARFDAVVKADCKIVKAAAPISGFSGEASVHLFFEK